MGRIIPYPSNFLELWGIKEVFDRFPRLRLKPFADDYLCIAGTLDFFAVKPGLPEIPDSFEISIELPFNFPKSLPLVFPTDDRIPQHFHRLTNGELCLGSPFRQLLFLSDSPNLLTFIDAFVVPYLYGFALFEKGMDLPFGELSHGTTGLLEDFCQLFQVTSRSVAKEMVHLTSRPKRKANKLICPCGRSLPLRRCAIHHRIVGEYRKKIGRLWFKRQYAQL